MIEYEGWWLDNEDMEHDEWRELKDYLHIIDTTLSNHLKYKDEFYTTKRYSVGELVNYIVEDVVHLRCYFRGYEMIEGMEVTLLQSEFADIGVFYSPLKNVYYMEGCYYQQ